MRTFCSKDFEKYFILFRISRWHIFPPLNDKNKMFNYLNNLKMKKNLASMKIAFLPAFLFAALLFSSCSKNELDELQITNPNGETSGSNSTKDVYSPSPTIPFGSMIGISHGSCMGSCPTYTVTVSEQGDVVYTGIANVAVRGPVRYKISADEAYQLGSMMEQMGFFNLASEYIVIPDAQRFETSLVWKDRIKSVVDYGVNVPQNLILMREQVEKALHIKRFIVGDPVDPSATNNK